MVTCNIQGLTSFNDYLLVGKNTIIDGGGKKIKIVDENFTGLIQINNNDITNFEESPIIQNIYFDFTSGSVLRAGSIIKESALFFQIKNCISYGNLINPDSGGICGRRMGLDTTSSPPRIGKCVIDSCVHIGDITTSAGGISGYVCGINSIVKNCIHLGNITGNNAGGILARLSGLTWNATTDNLRSIIFVNNCYSIGDITNTSAGSGGIMGNQICRDGGKAIINNCYYIGDIGGTDSGGIVGSLVNRVVAGTDFGTTEINNCFHIGNLIGIDTNSMFGDGPSGDISVKNCYSVGNNTSSTQSFLCSNSTNQTSNNVILQDCYVIGSGNIGLIAGINANSLTVKNCVVDPSKTNLFGAGVIPDISENISTNLNDISGQLYSFWENSENNWNAVDGSYPILKAFTQSPWGGNYNFYEPSGSQLPILLPFQSSPWDSTTYQEAENEPSFLNIVQFLQCYISPEVQKRTNMMSNLMSITNRSVQQRFNYIANRVGLENLNTVLLDKKKTSVGINNYASDVILKKKLIAIGNYSKGDYPIKC